MVDLSERDEWIAERAAIMEFDAKIPRRTAEGLAKQEWDRTHPAGPGADGPIRKVAQP